MFKWRINIDFVYMCFICVNYLCTLIGNDMLRWHLLVIGMVNRIWLGPSLFFISPKHASMHAYVHCICLVIGEHPWQRLASDLHKKLCSTPHFYLPLKISLNLKKTVESYRVQRGRLTALSPIGIFIMVLIKVCAVCIYT